MKASYAARWQDFTLSFGSWGTRSRMYNQTSRKGGNLVVQLGFPSDHAELMGRYQPRTCRALYEPVLHPIRRSGRPTLAWARVDLDLDRGVALIEEVQSDWLRFARWELEQLRADPDPRRRRKLPGFEIYFEQLRQRYEKVWPRAMLLAVLILLRKEFLCHQVWMHQPRSGVVLKRIEGAPPPASLYSALPQRFGFRPVRVVPDSLRRERRFEIARLMREDAPLFWRLDVTAEVGHENARLGVHAPAR